MKNRIITDRQVKDQEEKEEALEVEFAAKLEYIVSKQSEKGLTIKSIYVTFVFMIAKVIFLSCEDKQSQEDNLKNLESSVRKVLKRFDDEKNNGGNGKIVA